MKKMFLAFVVAGLASTMAFAQDDYDYGDDSAASSDDGFTDVGSNESAAESAPASDVEYKSMDDKDKKVSRNEGEMASLFDRQFNIGGKLSLGYAGFWNKQMNVTVDPITGATTETDPFKGWMGVQGSLGVIFNYHINSFLSIVPEFTFEIRNYFSDADGYYYVTYTDAYGYPASGWADDVQYNLRQYNILVPVMVRYNPTPELYIEAGASIAINLGAEFALTSDAYGIDQTEDSWECEDMNYAVAFGAGYTLSLGNNKFGDIGGRVSLDLNGLEKENNTRAWSFQLIITGYAPL